MKMRPSQWSGFGPTAQVGALCFLVVCAIIFAWSTDYCTWRFGSASWAIILGTWEAAEQGTYKEWQSSKVYSQTLEEMTCWQLWRNWSMLASVVVLVVSLCSLFIRRDRFVVAAVACCLVAATKAFLSGSILF
jgi:hypothetical protein